MTSAQQKNLLTGRWRKLVEPQKEVDVLHIPLVSTLRWCLRPDVVWRHVPNGEHRDPRTAAKLKAMGVLPAAPIWNSSTATPPVRRACCFSN